MTLVPGELWHYEGKDSLPVGAVRVEPFGFEIPIFFKPEDLTEYYGKVMGVKDPPEPEKNCFGYMVWIEEPERGIYFGLMFKPDVTIQTIVHECSHLVDAIFEQCGVDPRWSNTETRAYTMGRLVDDVKSVFDAYNEEIEGLFK